MSTRKLLAKSRKKAVNKRGKGDIGPPLVDSTHSHVNTSPWRRSLNGIPTGRQLPRTPPSTETPTPAPARNAPSGSGVEETFSPAASNVRTHGVAIPTSPKPQWGEGRIVERRGSSISASVKVEEMNPECFIKGMQGYQWTASDLEFVERTRTERQVQHLKGELNVVLKELKDEQQRHMLSLATKAKIQADLAEIQQFHQLEKLGRDFLSEKQQKCAAEVEVLDSHSLMAQISLADVQQAIQELKAEQVALKEDLTKLQEVYRKEEDEHQENMKSLNRRLTQKQATLDDLKKEVSHLKKMIAQEKKAPNSSLSKLAARKPPKPQETGAHVEVETGGALRRSKRIASKKENFQGRKAVLKKSSV